MIKHTTNTKLLVLVLWSFELDTGTKPFSLLVTSRVFVNESIAYCSSVEEVIKEADIEPKYHIQYRL